MGRIADFALYLSSRLWVLAMAVILVATFRLAAEAFSAPAPRDTVVIRIP